MYASGSFSSLMDAGRLDRDCSQVVTIGMPIFYYYGNSTISTTKPPLLTAHALPGIDEGIGDGGYLLKELLCFPR